MVDRVSSSKRSEIMSHNKAKNTSIELVVRRFLHKHGFRFRLHQRDLPGCPDIVLRKYSLCIFVNGCFWHQHLGCKKATIPKTNRDFWIDKFRKNALRDDVVRHKLESLGWHVLVVWECQTKNEETLLRILSQALPIRKLI